MRFNEWRSAMEAEQQRLAENGFLEEIKEFFRVDDRNMVLLVGENIRIEHEGMRDLKWLQPYFSGNRAVFTQLLESTQERVSQSIETTNHILNSMVEAHLPGITIQRMKGEQVETDPKVIFNRMVTKKMEELVRPLVKTPTPFKEYDFEWELAGQYFSVERNFRGVVTFGWLTLKVSVINNESFNSMIPHIKDAILFLGNYDLIAAGLGRFVNKLVECGNLE